MFSNRKGNKMWLLCAMLPLLLVLSAGCIVDTQGTLSTPEPSDSSIGMRSTLLYYVNNDGLTVPVMRRIPWEEGIGCAALECLTASAINAAEVSAMGLQTLIPEGVDFELTIDGDKCATLNIINLPKLPDAATERAMLETVVNTLVEFPTIDSVTILLDGKSAKALPLGTPLQEGMTRFAVNTIEDAPVSATGEVVSAMTVYFPSSSCAMQVPVTMYASGEPTFEAAMRKMMQGVDTGGLKNCFPGGTALLSASLTDGVAAVNLSGEFAGITDTADGVYSALYKAIYLTAKEFGPVSDLRIYVEGEYYMPEDAGIISAPLYPNEWNA